MTITYLVKRFALLVLVMWSAATINFFIPKLSPRDPILEKLQQAAMGGGRQQSGLKEMVAAYQKQFGLDKPLWEQYVTYIGNMARLDFGYSLSGYPRKVIDVIGDAMPWTIGLALVSTLLVLWHWHYPGCADRLAQSPAIFTLFHAAVDYAVCFARIFARLRADLFSRIPLAITAAVRCL